MEGTRRRRWELIAGVLAILAIGCLLVSVQFYFWPEATSVPRPDLGRTYVLNNHGQLLYLTKSEWRVQHDFEIAAEVLIGLAIITGYLSRERRLDKPTRKSWWRQRSRELKDTEGNWRPY